VKPQPTQLWLLELMVAVLCTRYTYLYTDSKEVRNFIDRLAAVHFKTIRLPPATRHATFAAEAVCLMADNIRNQRKLLTLWNA
jgi:hypothetical protein